MPAGYSRRPLVQKLGIKPGFKVVFFAMPRGYEKTLGRLPEGASVARAGDQVDFIQLFAKDRASLERDMPPLKAVLKRDGMLWVSWPKAASGVPTDLGDRAVREVGLSNGLVDVKVCAIDETWSGLKFVRRVKDRRVSAIDA